MKVEKIHDNKISVYISIKDLNERNIDMFEFYPQSTKIQILFEDILEEAYLQQGFDTEGYQLYVEAKPMPNHGFYVSITKFFDEDELDEEHSYGYIISEIGNFFPKPGESKPNNELIFRFPSIEAIHPCIHYLDHYHFVESGLFELNGSYILTLKVEDSENTTSAMAAFLGEYGAQEYYSYAYIDEHGKRILAKNALTGLKIYFDKI